VIQKYSGRSAGTVEVFDSSSAYTVMAIRRRSAFYFHCALSQKSMAHA